MSSQNRTDCPVTSGLGVQCTPDYANAERYSQDNIRRMQSLLTGRNLAVDNRLRAYLRRNDNRVSVDFLDSLAIQSVHLVKQLEPHNAPDPVIWFGYYAAE